VDDIVQVTRSVCSVKHIGTHQACQLMVYGRVDEHT